MSHPALERTDHRPWPVPGAPWRWRQSWCDLAFAHWPVDADRLRSLVPRPLEIDERDGTSWVGVVPFRMTGVTRRGWPVLRGLSAFPEINLRLYVTHEERPGVWFLSLDAPNPLAVLVARTLFALPYHRASIELEERDGWLEYRSKRGSGPDAVSFLGRYRPESEAAPAAPDSLSHWLTERYCLYAASPRRGLLRAEVHHPPWDLREAMIEIDANDLGRPHGLSLAGAPSLVHFSRRIDVVMWSPEPVTPAGR